MSSIIKKFINNDKKNLSSSQQLNLSKSQNNIEYKQNQPHQSPNTNNEKKLNFKLSESTFKLKKSSPKYNSTIPNINTASPSLDSNSFQFPQSPYQSCYNFNESPKQQSINSNNINYNNQNNILKKSQSSNSHLISTIQPNTSSNESPNHLQNNRKILYSSMDSNSGKSNFELKSNSSPTAVYYQSQQNSMLNQNQVSRKKSNLSFIENFGKKKQLIKDQQEMIEQLKTENLRLNDKYILDKIKNEIEVSKLNQKVEDLEQSYNLLFSLLQDYQQENMNMKSKIQELHQFHKQTQTSVQNKNIEDALKSLDDAFSYINQLQEQSITLSPLKEIYHNIQMLPSPISKSIPQHRGYHSRDENDDVSSLCSDTMSLSSDYQIGDDLETILAQNTGSAEYLKSLESSGNCEYKMLSKEYSLPTCLQEDPLSSPSFCSPQLLISPSNLSECCLNNELTLVKPFSNTTTTTTNGISTYSSVSPLTGHSLSSSCSSVTTEDEVSSSNFSQSGAICSKDISLIESQCIPIFVTSQLNRNSISISSSSSPPHLNQSTESVNTTNTTNANNSSIISMPISPKPLTPKSTSIASTSTLTSSFVLTSPKNHCTTTTNNSKQPQNTSPQKQTVVTPMINNLTSKSVPFKSNTLRSGSISRPNTPSSFLNSPDSQSSNSSIITKSQTLTPNSKIYRPLSTTSRPILKTPSVPNSPQFDSASAVKKLVDFFESPIKPLKL
ncbi:hypothetical protein DLAC_01325 [Tieghemostelium lacteum]|uniref:Uncharacterized protein n=1 Tax=Tieghemostelium lacteum TaxID=361077 RepID=A0A152A8Q2_TIELA|nr:hypothetical protein DLAC_01325 [Tieghemostelium lacteum]|eukprot:KYR02485.1 hypothetical protein DLAC_01325 [Tieghemostelium lacteum]